MQKQHSTGAAQPSFAPLGMPWVKNIYMWGIVMCRRKLNITTEDLSPYGVDFVFCNFVDIQHHNKGR